MEQWDGNECEKQGDRRKLEDLSTIRALAKAKWLELSFH